MIKYKASKWYPFISKIEVDKETDKFVFIEGRREAKISSYSSCFDSFEEAKKHLVDKANEKCVSLRMQLERANGHLGNMKGLKDDCNNQSW